MVSSEFDCALTYVAGSELNAMIKTSNSDVLEISTYPVTSLDADFAANVADQTKVQAGPLCWAIRIGPFIYTKKADNSVFQKQLIASAWKDAIYDISLRIAFVDDKIYKWDSAAANYLDTTIATIALTGLKSTIKLYTNPDQTRIYIFSYQ